MAELDQTQSIKRALAEQLEGFLGSRPPQASAQFKARIAELLAQIDGAEVQRLLERVTSAGSEWGYFPPEQFARDVNHAMADVTLTDDSGLEHAERLMAVRDRTLVLVPNHISYSDANLLEIILNRAGLSDVSNRMTVVAGPKVYSDPVRRFMSLCFGTIKTAQSTSLASGEAVMPPREVARIALLTISNAMARLDAGDALVVFAEGTRSRNAAMQPVLAGVSRYLERAGSVIVPIGITGTEHLNPVDAGELHATRVVIRVGEPIEASELLRQATGKRPAMAEALGRAIAATLPPEHRGVYA